MTRRLARLVVFAVAVAILPAASAGGPDLTERAAAIERAATGPDGVRLVVGHISRKLGISVETLRTERAQSGLGWGDLFVAHRLATAAGRSLDTITAEFRAGKTWEQIADAHGVDAAKLMADVQQSQEVIEQRAEDRPPNREVLSGPGRPTSGGGLGRRY